MKRPWWQFSTRKLMGLVAIFAGLSFVARAIQVSQENSARVQCMYSLKMLMLGQHSFESSHGHFAMGYQPPLPQSQRGLSWFVEIVPFIESSKGMSFDPTKPWNDPVNLNGWPFQNHWSCFICPSAPQTPTPGLPPLIDYIGIAGLGLDAPSLPANHPRAGFFSDVRSTKVADITDGLSTTMAIAETQSNRGPWTAGGYATVRPLDPTHQPYIGQGCQFGNSHSAGSMIVFADGSIRTIGPNINKNVFEAMSTIAGGEVVPALSGK